MLFSIFRFRELTGVYLSRITVVGHAFKRRRRFEQLHRLALRWPGSRFAYEGFPLRNEEDEREAATGVLSHHFYSTQSCVSYKILLHQLAIAYTPSTGDLYSCHAPLVQKRAGRNYHANSRLSCRCT
jgi:hypothetical protein